MQYGCGLENSLIEYKKKSIRRERKKGRKERK